MRLSPRYSALIVLVAGASSAAIAPACIDVNDVTTACSNDQTQCDGVDSGPDSTTTGDTAVDTFTDSARPDTNADAFDTTAEVDSGSDVGPDTRETCVPLTTCPSGKECGTLFDGCTGSINCGTCTGGKTCNTATNKCETVCTPITACPSTACLTIDNGCGTGTLTCPACPTGKSCDATLHTCVCAPLTACPGGRVCGTFDNGCGGTLTCGSLGGACPSGQVCDATPGTCRVVGCTTAGAKRCSPTSPKVVQTCATDLSGFTDTVTCPVECKVGACTTVVSVARGFYHTCAVLSDGSVRCWGRNNHGQLGDGTNTDRLRPTIVSGITTAVGVTATAQDTCVWLADGTVRCWGDFSSGVTGDGATADRLSPVIATGAANILELVGGLGHVCGRTATGGLVCWGDNGLGQLGDGTTGAQTSPAVIPGVTGLSQLAAGTLYTCGLFGAAVKCWGSNTTYQLGDGTTTTRLSPVSTVPALTTARSITANGYTTCATLTDNTLMCWGSNSDFEFGDGSTTFSSGPKLSAGVVGATKTTLAGWSAYAFFASGNVSAWGTDAYPLGSTPKNSPALKNALTVAGFQFSGTAGSRSQKSWCALVAGNLLCWGENTYGEVGDGTTSSVAAPTGVNW